MLPVASKPASAGRLRRAVQSGADSFSQQVQRASPQALRLAGAAEVYGYYVEGFGVMFHIRIPGMTPDFALLMRRMLANPATATVQGNPQVTRVAAPPPPNRGVPTSPDQ